MGAGVVLEKTQQAALSFAEAVVDEAAKEAGARAFKLLCDRHFAEKTRWLTAADAGRYIGATRQRIADLTYARRLVPAGYDGRSPRYTREQLDVYLASAANANGGPG
jgi:hypothetical protein